MDFSNLKQLINPLGNAKSVLKTTISQTLSSAPMSKIRESVSGMLEYLNGRKDRYESLSSGFSCLNELFDDAADMLDHKVVELDDLGNRFISLESDAAQAFLVGFKQSLISSIDDTSDAYLGSDISRYTVEALKAFNQTISDVDGLLYQLKFDVINGVDAIVQVCSNGTVPLLFYEAGVYKLNTVIHPLKTKLISSRDSYSTYVTMTSTLLMGLGIQTSSTTLKGMTDDLTSFFQVGSHSDILSGLIAICISLDCLPSDQTIKDCLLAIIEDQFNEVTSSPLVYVVKSIITSSDINEAYRLICEALLSSTPVESIRSLVNTVDERFKVIKSVFNRCITALNQGGIRGVFKFVSAYFEGGTTITNSDGTLSFTNNLKLLPAEFIAGVIVTVTSVLVSIAGVIITACGHVWGMALTSVGGVGLELFKSVRGTYDDTYASMNEVFTDDEMNKLGCTPFCIYQGEISASDVTLFDYFKKQYDVHQCCCYFSVPGGILFLGPGAFTSNAGDSPSITAFRFEFHPFTTVFRGLSAFNDDQTAIDKYNYWIGKFCYKINGNYWPNASYWSEMPTQKAGAYRDIKDIYSGLVENCCYSLLNSDETGHLSSTDDARLKVSIAIHCAFFYLWISQQLSNGYSYSFDPNMDVTKSLVINDSYVTDPSSGDYSGVRNFPWLCICFAMNCSSSIVSSRIPTWNTLIEHCDRYINTYSVRVAYLTNSDISDLDIQPFWIFEEDSYTQQINLYRLTSQGKLHYYQVSPTLWAMTSSSLDNMCGSLVTPIPNTFSYNVTLPKYNSATYWFWLIFANAVVAAITVGAIVASFKIKRWAQKKRSANKVKFDTKQQDYANALNGIVTEEVWDEQAQKYKEVEYKFDTSTPEGQQIIENAFKDYRKQARRNNMWANIIGGSRYDVGTFWGEKEVDDGVAAGSEDEPSFMEKLAALSGDNSDVASTQLETTSQSIMTNQLTRLAMLVSGNTELPDVDSLYNES